MAAKNGKAAAALVIGAGIAGVKAALELAESGAKVYLCDRKPYIGGMLTRLDKWFPDNHCGMCKVLPVFDRDMSSQYCLRRGLVHPNIELLSLTQVQSVEGDAGDFSVTLHVKSSWVKPELCVGCGLCEQACPVEVDYELNQGLEKCKAIYLPHPLVIPKVYTINTEYCTRCGACVDACPTGAIVLSTPDETREIEVGAIILSTGFEHFDPSPATQYGYKRYPNVITSVELERLLSGSGPSQGSLLRLSDGQVPKSVAFLQCVGSRDRQRDYCSSACCMYAIKEAMMIKELHPEIDAHIFFMDIRAFGKGYYRYYEQARDALGIKFTRCRVPTVKQDFQNKDLLITAIDQHDELITNRFDLVVLTVGQTPSPQFGELSHILGLESNKWGFCRSGDFSAVETTREGIFVCGSASAPKDIADTLIEATAAAGQVLTLIEPARPSPAELPSISEEEPKVAISICNCAGQIAQSVNVKELIESSKKLPGVVYVEEVAHLCQQEAWQETKARLIESGANRVILAACSIHPPYGLFGETPIELINIREGLAWVHQNDIKAATEKGKHLIAMALEKVKGIESPLPSYTESVTPGALVVGGGIAGLVAALSIAERGFEVELVEKSDELGGNARHIYSLLEGGDPQEYLHNLTDKVESNSHIHLRQGTEVVQVTGYAGNFKCTLRDKESELHDIDACVIIVATGAEESQPVEYLYAQAEQVISQRELEERLASGQLDARELKSVVMIQCVGSRDKDRPYCSRICCSQALKNALTLKRRNPEIEVVVFYRDLMSYGFKEEYYTRAREEGVLFIRYDLEQKPQVTLDSETLKIQAVEPVLGESIVLKPDLLVLSPAIVPHENAGLAQMLGVELTEDGFFKETDSKFLPVDFTKAGIFVCGLANHPRDMNETIVQAQAAAQRAALLLGRARLVSGKIVSQVNERWCSGCELCVAVCPFDARIKDADKGVVIVRESLCQGCGACVAACPSGAASLREFSDKQIFGMVDAAL